MSGYSWGGSEELWSQAALRLNKSGKQVIASLSYWPVLAPKVVELRNQGIPLSFRQVSSRSLLNRIKQKVLFRGKDMEAIKWLSEHKPDLVVISQGDNIEGLGWMENCRELNLPYAVIVQANNDSWWPPQELGARMAQAYLGAKKVFCVSQHNLELLQCQVGESLNNAIVVWNPYNVDASQIIGWPQESDVLKLACVARLEPFAKGQDILLRVLGKQRWRDRPIELTLYGSGPFESCLRRLAKRLKLQNVKFFGHTNNVSDIWANNHLLVLPSRYEGTPLALVEAMWCGRPAIVTDVGGNSELCLDGETGFVAQAPTMKLFDDALERAWTNKNLLQAMGGLARNRAEKIIPTDPIREFCDVLLGL
jgi:glycosyltransferase involved in cell wall biosynthesis